MSGAQGHNVLHICPQTDLPVPSCLALHQVEAKAKMKVIICPQSFVSVCPHTDLFVHSCLALHQVEAKANMKVRICPQRD